MSSRSYDDILKQVQQLSQEEQQRLIQELLSEISPAEPSKGKTLGECMEQRGLLGIASGPRDLSTNPKHMEGFGEDT